MAYCTPEDTEYLAERGFGLTNDGQAFNKVEGGTLYMVHPVWRHKKPGDLNTPPPEEVFWSATKIQTDFTGNVEVVVRLIDQQATPTSCFVTAEIRGWKHEQ